MSCKYEIEYTATNKIKNKCNYSQKTTHHYLSKTRRYIKDNNGILERMMQATYDKAADAAYIQFIKAKTAKTIELSATQFADYDKQGRLIGIEILDAKKNIPPSMLRQFVRIDEKTTN